MKYEYISAYQIMGLSSNPELGDVEVYKSDDSRIRAIFTPDVDAHCYNVDLAGALSRSLLVGLAGQREDFPRALENEVIAIRERRTKSLGLEAVLLIRIIGEVEANLSEIKKITNEYGFGFDLMDKTALKSYHKNITSYILSAACLSTDPPTDIKRLVEGLYLLDDEGVRFYSFSLSAYGGGHTSLKITKEITDQVSLRAKQVMGNTSLNKIIRLLTQTSDKATDKFRSFIFAWTALEIFVNQTCPFYETEFVTKLIGNNVSPSTTRYFQRVQAVMKDKFRLTDKFAIIAEFLGGESTAADIETFSKLKGVRDNIFHGQEFDERSLPSNELRALLSKYLRQHLTYCS